MRNSGVQKFKYILNKQEHKKSLMRTIYIFYY